MNTSKMEIERFKNLSENLKDFTLQFVHVGVGKIDLNNDESLFVNMLFTLVSTNEILNLLIKKLEDENNEN